jgi:hypothetical protein
MPDVSCGREPRGRTAFRFAGLPRTAGRDAFESRTDLNVSGCTHGYLRSESWGFESLRASPHQEPEPLRKCLVGAGAQGRRCAPGPVANVFAAA